MSISIHSLSTKVPAKPKGWLGAVEEVVDGPVRLVEVAVEGDARNVEVAGRVKPDDRVARPVEVLQRRVEPVGGGVGWKPGDHRVVAVGEWRGAEPGRPTIEGEVDGHPGIGEVWNHAVVVGGRGDDVARVVGHR